MNDLQVFKSSKFGNVRTIHLDGEILFAASDVAAALGYRNAPDAVNRHCRCIVKRDIPHPQNPDRSLTLNFIRKGDVIRLVANSELPGAAEFESWIFDEVIPAVLENGFYSTKPLLSQLQIMRQAVDVMMQQEQRITGLEATTQAFKDTLLTTPENWRREVNDMFNKAAMKAGGGAMYEELRKQTYELLEDRAGVKLNIRLTNKRRRMLEQGVPSKMVSKANFLDVIADDIKLREIYTAIVKEAFLKYAV